MESHSEQDEHAPDSVVLPKPTAWPMVLALGLSLIVAGMVTNVSISVLGLVLALRATVGWFLEVLPVEQHEAFQVEAPLVAAPSRQVEVARISIDPLHRKMLPLESYTVLSGIKGGLAGGIAMAVPAMLFGLIKFHSIWYPINLLAAGGFVEWAGQSDAFLAQFHWNGFLAALAIHGATSLLVGLLYGAMLPMFPKMPILTAGFIAP